MKGFNRQMAVVKNADSTLFKKAFCLIRNKAKDNPDMLAECERIIRESLDRNSRGYFHRRKELFIVFCVLMAIAIVGTVLFAIYTL